MRQAMKIILETNDTIADIASQVGYQTQGKFSSAFQSIVKMSPREYRKIQGIASSDPLAKTVMKNSGRLLPAKPNTNIKILATLMVSIPAVSSRRINSRETNTP